VGEVTDDPTFSPASFADFESEIMASYVDQCTDVMGVTTGWKGLDDLYRVSCAQKGWCAHAAQGVVRCQTGAAHALTSAHTNASLAPQTPLSDRPRRTHHCHRHSQLGQIRVD
jgi:hypothetical protein